MKILNVLRPGRSEGNIDSIGAMSLPINVARHLKGKGVTETFVTDANLEEFTCYHYPEQKPKLGDYVKNAFDIYRQCKYDIIHFQLFNYSYVPHVLAQLQETDKVVLTCHLPPDCGRSFFNVQEPMAELLKKPNVFVVGVSSSGVTMQMIERGVADLHNLQLLTIYNGVRSYEDILYIPYKERKRGAVIIGRMEQSKNILEGLNFCYTRRIPVTYIGTGTQSKSEASQHYEEQVRYALSHFPGIEHHESLPNHQVHEILADSKFNLSLSTLESFGMSLVEANMVGTPNIYLDIPGVRDTQMDTFTGLKIPPDQIYRKTWPTRYFVMENLVKALPEVFNDYRLQSLKQVTQLGLSIETCADRYQKLYDSILRGTGDVYY